MSNNDLRLLRIRGYEFENVVPWEAIIDSMESSFVTTYGGPEPRELRCQCCGGYAGHGFRDPEHCGHCREAGEHEPVEDDA